MQWTIRVELTPDGNPPITYDIGTITRPIANLSPEQIGLTLEEGQQLLRRVQVEIIASQAHAYALYRRACVDCGRPKRIKDTRAKCVQMVFGAFRFRGRRYRDIGMRLELLRKAVVMPVTYQEYLDDPEAFGPMQRRVSRLRSALWRGRSWQALLQFAWLRKDIDRWAAEHPGGRQVIKEFWYYVCGNRRSLPDFAKQRAAGHRISTAYVESVMNHLVNHRLSKKQQMRWSPAGAHYLLQVRAELLNPSLLDGYRMANPRFRGPSGFSCAA